MSENTFNTISDYQLNEENKKLLRDLEECHKKIEFLENYRKLCLKLSEECVCLTAITIFEFKLLEKQYQNIFLTNDGSDAQQDNNNTEDNQIIEHNSDKN